MEPRPAQADRPRFRAATLLIAGNAIGLLLVSAWFRCRSLENIPGINGDEAWYGVKALQFLWERQYHVQTPTGNPPNPFFFGPVLLLHLVFPPSIALLRWVSALSGLAMLIVNWLMCRWVFDRRTALISTLALAVLPINIAYSRFAWDASQSVLATLPIVYFSLAAVRFPQQRGRWVMAAGLAQIAALMVHPTNIFAGVIIAAALAVWVPWWEVRRTLVSQMRSHPLRSGTAVVVILLLVFAVGSMAAGSPRLSRFTKHMAKRDELPHPATESRYAVLYARLFTGGTVYRDIAGSRSWWEWPSADDAEGWGIDAVLFWAVVAAALWLLWRSRKMEGRLEDRVLIAAWVLQSLAFLLVAGPRGLIPGWQRYAMCLVAPTVVLTSRGLASCGVDSVWRRRLVLVAASLTGWLVLADFHANYFRFIRQTGGCGHETFRTAAVEPKQRALQYIVQHRNTQTGNDASTTWLVTSQWWNYWPLRYLAMAEERIRVVEPAEIDNSPEFELARRQGRVWCAEFSGSEELDRARAIFKDHTVDRCNFPDYGGRPLLTLLHGK